MAEPDPQEQARARELVEEALAKAAAASRSFAARIRSQAAIDLRELIDPEGEAVTSLVDVEHAPGAAALALPIDLITFETWVLGNLGDRDELDLDVNTHREVWFGLGAWLGETLRARHGGFWLLGGDDPRAWRIGFAKILLEIAPHAFAEKLLRSGQGLARRMVAEVERIRVTHEEAARAEGDKAGQDRFTPHHYARLHAVPLAQWLVLDMNRLVAGWGQKPAGELVAEVAEAARKLPGQNAPVVDRVLETLGALDADKPAAPQVADRGLFEAVAQILGLRRATPPIAVDVLEKIMLPALHVGLPDRFPPLGADDVANLKKGNDLFAVFVDVVPYEHPAEEGGFLGTFSPQDLGTPYADRKNIDIGKGDWVAVNPARLAGMLERFDAKKLLACYDRFVAYVQQQDGVPRLRETGRGLAETTARVLFDLKALVGAIEPGNALVFRLLPPPG